MQNIGNGYHKAAHRDQLRHAAKEVRRSASNIQTHVTTYGEAYAAWKTAGLLGTLSVRLLRWLPHKKAMAVSMFIELGPPPRLRHINPSLLAISTPSLPLPTTSLSLLHHHPTDRSLSVLPISDISFRSHVTHPCRSCMPISPSAVEPSA